jgi:type I restriction enzyme S subunit
MSREASEVREVSPGYALKAAKPMVPEGYKQTEVGVIPEHWSVAPLRQEVAKLEAGVSVNSVDENLGSYSHEQSVLKTSSVADGRFYSDECKKIAPRDLSRVSLSPRADTLLISRMNTPDLVGECGYVDKDFPHLFLPDRLWMTQKHVNSKASFRWLSYLLSSKPQKSRIKGLATGTSGSMKNISKDSLLDTLLPFPPPEEQEAIATALSDVDTLLEHLDRLIAKKRDIKQATMQQLLTGQTRLPGFEGEWETCAIEDLAHVGRGRVISHREISKSTEPRYPVFSSQTSNDGIMGYIDTFDFDGEYITWTTDGANAGTVFARKGKFNCTNVCGTIKPRFGDYHFIAMALGRVSMPHVSRHLGNPKLMNDVVKKITISLPPTHCEQTAIATVFSRMSAEIQAVEQRRAKTSAVKQAMMQGLLTGKVRLL